MFRSFCSSVFKPVESLMVMSKEHAVPVRYRYFADRPTLVRRWGYEDKLAWRGPLPRYETDRRIPQPEYNPKMPWVEKRALFGQNDYIDILGNPDMHPVMIAYNVPGWLRGFKGNEFQMLLRKRKMHGNRIKAMAPGTWKELQKRIKFLYRFLNRWKPQDRKQPGYDHWNSNK